MLLRLLRQIVSISDTQNYFFQKIPKTGSLEPIIVCVLFGKEKVQSQIFDRASLSDFLGSNFAARVDSGPP